MVHNTSGLSDDLVGPIKTIIQPIKRKFNPLSKDRSLDFSIVRLITAHSGILTFSGHQLISLGLIVLKPMENETRITLSILRTTGANNGIVRLPFQTLPYHFLDDGL